MSAVIVDRLWHEVARAIRAEAARCKASILTIQRAMRIGLHELDQGRTPAVCVAEATRLFRNAQFPHHNGPATA